MDSIVNEFHRVVAALRSRCSCRRFVCKRPASSRLIQTQSKKSPLPIPAALESLLIEVGRKIEFQWSVLPSHRSSLPRGLKKTVNGYLCTSHLVERSWLRSDVIELSESVYARSRNMIWIGDLFAGPPRLRIRQNLDDFLWHWTRLGFISLDDDEQVAPFLDRKSGRLDSNGTNGRKWRAFLGCADE